jgi:cytidylate kinase
MDGKVSGDDSGNVITIDGPAGAGKSTIARALAEKLGFFFLDTGALYRAVALHLLRSGVNPEEEVVPDDALKGIDLRVASGTGRMNVFLGDEDVSERIRDESTGEAASIFSAGPEVRRALLDLQRSLAAGAGRGVVAEGRDMGTVVFPHAAVKFFLTADLRERAKRRHAELREKGASPPLEEILTDMRARDRRDESRSRSPLVQAPDAVVVDTTALSPDRVLQVLLDHVAARPRFSDSSGN